MSLSVIPQELIDDTAPILELVGAAFGDDALKTFCFGVFPSVYDEFTAEQSKSARVLTLVEYAKRHGLLRELLGGVQKANPYQYARFIHERLAASMAETEQAEAKQDWPQVLHFYQRILKIAECYKDFPFKAQVNESAAQLKIDEYYNNASERLAEAEKHRRLQSLYTEAEQAYARKDWPRAIELYRQALAIDENYQDASQKLAEAQKQERLQSLYTQAEQAFAAKDWAQAIELLKRVLAIDGKYMDAPQMLSQAIRQRRFEQLRARIKQAAIPSIAIMALAAIVMGLWRYWPDIGALLLQPMPAAMPTSAWTLTPATTPLSTLMSTPIPTSTPALTFTPILTPVPSPTVGITVTLRGQSLPIECGGKVLLPSSGIILTMADIPITAEQERELHWSALIGKMRPQEGRTSAYSQDPNALTPDVVSLERKGIRICYFYVVVQQTP
jgi:hypothetical protein